jgi:hypothetical protein
MLVLKGAHRILFAESSVLRIALLIIAVLPFLSGCRSTGDALFDGVFDMFWDAGTDAISGSDRLSEDDRHIARRKGMSDDEYRSLKRQEEQWRELRED